MLLLSEQTTLNHAGLNPQSIATVGSLLGDRATIVAKLGGDGGQGAGSATGGSTTLQTGLIYANTTVPGGNTVANTVTPTNFASTYVLAANALSMGQVLFIKAWGVYGTAVVAPTLTLDLRWRTLTLCTTGAVTCVANLTNAGWWLEAQLHVQSLGGTGTLESQAFTNLSTALTTVQAIDMPNTAPVTISTILSNTIALRATWGTAAAANTITLRNLSIRLEQAQTFS